MVLAWRSLKDDRRGVTSIEYAVIAGLVSCAIVVALTILGSSLGGLFTSLGDQFGSSPPPATPNAVHGGQTQ